MIQVSDFKRGVCFTFKGQPVTIVDFTVSTPTARGGTVIAKTRLRNLVTGQLLSESIRSGDKFPPLDVEKTAIAYLYSDGADFHFMDNDTYDQFQMSAEDLGDIAPWLTEGMEGLLGLKVEGRVVSIEIPKTVTLEVVEADPVMKGATAKAQTKRAVVTTGMEVQVPAYVVPGQLIKLDTKDGRFIERVNS